MERLTVGRRILMSSMDGVEFSSDAASVGGMMFGSYEVGSPESCTSDDFEDTDDRNDDRDGDGGSRSVDNEDYWKKKELLLHEILNKRSSLESGVRKAIDEALRIARSPKTICNCRKTITEECRNCMLGNISEHLRKAGYNSAICKSKWRSSPDTPSGEHTYIDVVDASNPKRGEVRVVVELNFRAEFEMTRAGDEYNRLAGMLPEIFVGRADRLRALIKIICPAGKKCMKEKKMHMAPWRKEAYVRAKWFGAYNRIVPTPTTFTPQGLADRLPRPRASMLTFDLLENLPSLHCTAVKVL